MTDGEVARAGGPARAVVATPPPPAHLGSTPPPPPPPGRPQRTSSSGDLPPGTPARRWWSLRGIGWVGWTWRIALVLVVGFLVWGIAGYIVLNSAVSNANSRITAAASKALTPSNGSMLTTPTNILFIGSDARPGQGASRSDTMMLMRVNPDSGKIKSSAEDVSPASMFTGLPVNHIVIVSFDGLTNVVNDLGGVTLNNPTPLKNCGYTGGIKVSFPGGPITLNGTTALQYVRVRDCDTDFQRERRQQVFLAALRSKIISPWLIWKAPWSGASLVSALSTDMSTTDMTELGWLEMTLSQPSKDHFLLPGTPTYIGNVNYVINEPNLSAAAKKAFMGKN